jgi:hypothetical protein
MADRDSVTQLGRLLGAVARAHHEETGGVNEHWAEWYASRLVGEIDSHVGFSPSLDKVREWLTGAHEKYRAEASEARWPFYYAELILDTIGGTDH